MRLKLKNKKAKKIVKKKPEVMKELPELVYGAVNVPFTPEELASYAQLLGIMSQGLLQMAQDAATNNDDNAVSILTARSQLSAVLAGKLSAHYDIGESPSRNVH